MYKQKAGGKAGGKRKAKGAPVDSSDEESDGGGSDDEDHEGDEEEEGSDCEEEGGEVEQETFDVKCIHEVKGKGRSSGRGTVRVLGSRPRSSRVQTMALEEYQDEQQKR